MRHVSKSTIYDIARAASASPSTVSSALNGTWKARRIRQETAERILKIAREHGYSANQQARGLRMARSGLMALLLPEYNRFFSNLAQCFSQAVRQRGQCPIIVATERNRQEELDSVRDLSGYAIDSLFVVGAVAPVEISQLCAELQIKTVFVDQPCALAPSVVTDNRLGACQLTTEILRTQMSIGNPLRDRPYFIGGDAALPATASRIEGFRQVVTQRAGAVSDDQIIACSYDSDRAEAEIAALTARIGGLPTALFINSASVFEGVLRFLVAMPEEDLRVCSFGCFDYEPFGRLLRFPVHMIRQRHKKLIGTAFDLLETGEPGTLVKVPPEVFSAD